MVQEGKIPPHSIEAEQAVIGALLVDSNAPFKVVGYLTPECFYDPAHQEVFRGIQSLFEKNKPIDLVTLTQELKRKKSLQKVGGASYLSKLAENVMTPAHVEEYAKIVYEKWVQRKLIEVTTNIIQKSYDEGADIEKLLDRAETLIFSIKNTRMKREVVAIKDLLLPMMYRIEKLRERRSYISGISTGFYELDELTTGLQYGDFIIIAGRPTVGKTSLALNIALHAAKEEHRPVAIFSLEMSKEEVVERAICSEAGIPMQKLRKAMLSPEDYRNLSETMGILNELEVYIDDTPSIPILELKAKARRLRSEKKIELIIIDYLQLITGTSTSPQVTRQQEIAEISKFLKAMGKELRIPVVAVSQLSRRPEHREDQIPRLADLRESGAIEQDADMVLLIYPSKKDPNIAKINIAKQRNGPSNKTIELVFLKEYTRFESLSLREEIPPEEE